MNNKKVIVKPPPFKVHYKTEGDDDKENVDNYISISITKCVIIVKMEE